jgi:hypothetical protein
MMNEEQLKKASEDFHKRLLEMTRNAGTPQAEFDCEICKTNTFFTNFVAFMYPDYTVKALCHGCGADEYLRLDYGNKN